MSKQKQQEDFEAIECLISVDAEEQVLGGVILESMGGSAEAARDLVQLVGQDAFWFERNKLVYRAIAHCAKHEQVPDAITLVSALSDLGHLDTVGGQQYIFRLMDGAIGYGVWRSHLELVRRKWLARRVHDAGDTLKAIALQTSIAPQELQERAQKAVEAPFAGVSPSVSFSKACSTVSARVMELIDRRLAGEALGLSSGFYDLDEIMDGWSNPLSGDEGRLIVLGARPAMGKTALALQLALKLAKTNEVGAAFFSLEMSAEQLMGRIVSLWAGVPVSSMRRPQRLSPDDLARVRDAARAAAQLPVRICDRPGITIDALRREVAVIQREFQSEGKALGLLVLDYLQLMEGGSESDRRVGVEQISRQLKLLSKELRCDVIALSQLSRAVESRTNKRPMLSDLRETGAIEQDADTVIFLYRDEYYNADTVDRGICEAIVAKQRSGPTGTVKMLFEAEFTRFRNLAKPRVPA